MEAEWKVKADKCVYSFTAATDGPIKFEFPNWNIEREKKKNNRFEFNLCAKI
jgi:hypothetical protein